MSHLRSLKIELDKMSPPLFLLSIFSVLTVWGITSLGLPPSLWTFVVVPLLLIYFLCDQSKLWGAAFQVAGSPVEIVGVAVVAPFIFYTMLWRPCLLLADLFFLVKALDMEKIRYMGDTYGELAKSFVWKVDSMFSGETKRMSYKGEWAFCSPYSRNLVRMEIDRYFTLQPKLASAVVQDEIVPEDYKLDFPIESCTVLCKYTNANEVSRETSGDCPVVPPHEENALLGPLQTPKGESSSSKRPVADQVKRYTFEPCHMSKLEVSLKYKKETLEGYTFYDREGESVTEAKRALDILKDNGNLIFSNLSRNVGSGTPQAHARCYEFQEIFELLLNENFKLHEVKLPAKLSCSISGTWVILLQVLLVISMTWMNYEQLKGTPKLSVLVSVLTINIVVQLLMILRKLRHRVRRFVHSIITLLTPKDKIEPLYRCFQVHVRWLTFGNESYGYPYTSSQREICMLGGTGFVAPQLPVIDTQVKGYLQLEQLIAFDGPRSFDLRALKLQVFVSHRDGDVFVDVTMRRRHNGVCFYKRLFTTDDRKTVNFIALMAWLEENGCIGVCRKWDKMDLMQVYTYDELFVMVLQGGAKPLIISLVSPIDITVEGI